MSHRARQVAAYDIATVRDRGELDDLATFAAELCEAPISLISLIDDVDQRFVARVGAEIDVAPADISFCGQAILGDTVMIVPDASLDSRFADHPMVKGEPYLRFYAGAPLVATDGTALGAICVFDVTTRADLTPLQKRGLSVLARAAMARLDDRRQAREQRQLEEQRSQELAASQIRFHTLADTMPQMVWSTLPDGHHDYYNARWYEFTGIPEGSTDGDGWNDVFHPDDQARAWAAWRHSLDTGKPYQIEYRLRHVDGTYRWVLGRALPIRDHGTDGSDGTGAITRWFGTCTDIHEQKLAIEEREIISQELSHRIKNIFAVIAGLVSFAARAKPEIAEVAADLRQRITALGRAHDFVRPHSAESRPAGQQDTLAGLLAELFEPYQQADGQRIVVSGDTIAIDDRSATPLALLFHELATNATKYGALSHHDGRIDVTVTADRDAATIRWIESGGPPVIAPTAASGFGTKLIELSAVRQLGGTIEREWRADGLAMTAHIPLAALSRG
ncbi:sensor histidine kinase [Sphingomonas oligophenolica]|uniref:sensor histidine kinase n=1 Tax=Sphingomonas oligophenolica TaxID=301154 RepID=UPI0018848139|nr:PAS domain-containing protein [Sphingomonas oligophenolica]